MLIGYGRVSTEDQDLRSQRTALGAAGCARVFEEKISGATRARPELERLLDQLRADDVVVVTRLDRLARSTRDLLDITETIERAGAGFKSLAEPWADTTSPSGRMIITVFAGIAEFERSLILERTSAGRRAARTRGVPFGRPRAIGDVQWAHFEPQLSAGIISVNEAAAVLGVNRATIYRRLSEGRDAIPALAVPLPSQEELQGSGAL